VSDADDKHPGSDPGPTLGHFCLTLDGEEHQVAFADGETLLQAALRAGVDAPHNCTQGRCGSCLSKLRAGEVNMPEARALSPKNRELGYVLACQSRPVPAQTIWLDFDI